MGNSAKAIITFAEPFWRGKQLSGFSFSHVGPLGEIHDNSPDDASNGVLFGFFVGLQSFRANAGKRESEVIAQLVKLQGVEAKNYIDYHDYAWWQDKLSIAPNDVSHCVIIRIMRIESFLKSIGMIVCISLELRLLLHKVGIWMGRLKLLCDYRKVKVWTFENL